MAVSGKVGAFNPLDMLSSSRLSSLASKQRLPEDDIDAEVLIDVNESFQDHSSSRNIPTAFLATSAAAAVPSSDEEDQVKTELVAPQQQQRSLRFSAAVPTAATGMPPKRTAHLPTTIASPVETSQYLESEVCKCLCFVVGIIDCHYYIYA